jgi:hypothetical protein
MELSGVDNGEQPEAGPQYCSGRTDQPECENQFPFHDAISKAHFVQVALLIPPAVLIAL